MTPRPLAICAALGLAFASLLGVAPPVRAAAYLVLQVEDVPGVGFDDPSPVAPAGGNPAARLGEARLRALEFAAGLWAERVESPVPIEIAVRFEPLGGTPTFATLGLGGPADVYRDFAGAPQPATWYPAALANRLAGVDLDGGTAPDLEVVFNLDVDGPEALGPGRFYYGLDGNPPAGDASFVQVALHEIAHGLGFTSQLNLATGAKLLGYDDAYMSWVERVGAVPPDLPSMTDGERLAALRSAPELRWVGTNLAAAAAALAAGADAQGRVELHAQPQITTSTLHHFATALEPDDVMEPFYAEGAWDLTLARALLADLGWGGPPGCLPAGPGDPVLAVDYFTTSASLAGWQAVDAAGASQGPSNWVVQNGLLRQTSNIFRLSDQAGTHLLWKGALTSDDYRVRITLNSGDDDNLGVLFRYRDAANHYRFRWARQTPIRLLERVENGQVTVLAQDQVSYLTSRWYSVAVEARGPDLAVWVDGEVVLTASDQVHPTGGVALYCDGNVNSYFEDFRVTRAQAGGEADDAFAAEHFAASTSLANWEIVDQGTSGAPSNWIWENGLLRQTKAIYTPNVSASGTFAVWRGVLPSDYRARVRVYSSDQNSIGLTFRHRDSDNYYRFAWSRIEAVQTLDRVVDGQLTVLAQAAVAYAQSTWYTVEIEAAGPRLSAWVDGQPVLTAWDEAHPAGGVGLYCRRNASTYFDDFVVGHSQ